MPTPPRILITAGPTHEPIDAVRYLANRSSGRMGIALADAASAIGFPTTILLGPTPLNPPHHPQLRVLRFQSTADLQGLLLEQWPQHDVLIMAAAVADYRPAPRRDAIEKIARGDGPLALMLEPTPDLLAEAAWTARPDQILVGFALEPGDRLLKSAGRKLARKGIHAIVANPLETMDSSNIDATVIFADGAQARPDGAIPKGEFARWLLESLAGRFGVFRQSK